MKLPYSNLSRFVLFVGILVVLLSSCKKNNYRKNFTGNYQFTRHYNYWDDFEGSTSYTRIDTGQIVLFEGHDGNHHDIRHKIGIILDNDGSLLNSWETSCFSDLTYGAYDYIHPTVDRKGKLTYPEYECYAWGYSSNFKGEIIGDSIYLNYGYSDATHGVTRTVYGKRID